MVEFCRLCHLKTVYIFFPFYYCYMGLFWHHALSVSEQMPGHVYYIKAFLELPILLREIYEKDSLANSCWWLSNRQLFQALVTFARWVTVRGSGYFTLVVQKASLCPHISLDNKAIHGYDIWRSWCLSDIQKNKNKKKGSSYCLLTMWSPDKGEREREEYTNTGNKEWENNGKNK